MDNSSQRCGLFRNMLRRFSSGGGGCGGGGEETAAAAAAASLAIGGSTQADLEERLLENHVWPPLDNKDMDDDKDDTQVSGAEQVQHLVVVFLAE